jgi:hypothetical protein
MGEYQMNPDMQTIAEATQWLTSSPDTHSGSLNGLYHVVREEATTDDGSALSPQGVYFGHTETYGQRGLGMLDTDIVLLDHTDSSSYHDHIPRTHYSPVLTRRLFCGMATGRV